MLKFGIIGDGDISKRHKWAINSLGHCVYKVFDPKHGHCLLEKNFFENLDWVVISSPSHLHYDHISTCLKHNVEVICEKPMVLPWQNIIDDDRINIVLQYRWADLPNKIDLINVSMVRNEDYFKTWKGDPLKTGGLFYNLFIHYVDLAIMHGSKFVGKVVTSGDNIRMADNIDLFTFDMNTLYTEMYRDILKGNGIKSRDIMYLHWFLERNSIIHGYGESAINQTIEICNYLP